MSAFYAVGTLSVTAGSASVAGSGTSWSGAVRPGDRLWVGGVSCRILSVNSGSSLTLAQPWPGASASGAAYEVWLTPDEAVLQGQLRDLLTMLADGNLEAIADLPTQADRLAYFTGPGTAALAPITPAARAVLALAGSTGARIPVITGSGSAALREIVGAVGQSGGVPTGALVEEGDNANGRYWRYAGGMQVAIIEGAEFVRDGPNELVYVWTYPAAFAAPPVCSVDLQNAGSYLTDVGYSDIGIHLHGGGAASNTHILTRVAGAEAFQATAKITGCRLSAIGRWHG